jgi:peptidyl-prolyl cis-trans isomerase A (cyclophilin A)
MRFILVLTLLAGLAGCNRSGSEEEASGGIVTPPKGPDRYRVQFETSKGNFVVDVVRGWSPLGADRFHDLVKAKFYDECRFFRVVPGFVAQWGISGDPAVNRKWRQDIDDDLPGVSNTAGTITFAKTNAPRSRGTQLFINFGDNSRLDSTGFTPFGRVTEGMSVVMSINAEYTDKADQGRITNEGNSYLKAEFPNMDYIKKATILP